MYKPKNFKFKKMFKSRLKNIHQTFTNKIDNSNFGTFILKSLEKGEVRPSQIEAVRKILSKEIKKFGKIWVRIFSSMIRTSKPAEVRMGKGKGSLNYWACLIKSGQILFEISNIKATIAFFLFKKAGNKLPLLTKIKKIGS
jgi:large subunit ribosomal protein L16